MASDPSASPPSTPPTSDRASAPWTLWTLLGLTSLAIAWFACTLAGLTPTTYVIPWTAYGAAFWGLLNLTFLVVSLSRIRSDRFASERRTAARLQVGGPASIQGHPGHLMDISMGGALIRCEDPPEHHQEPLQIEVQRNENEIMLSGEERGRQTLPDGSALIRLQFTEHQAPELARLATTLFGSIPQKPSEQASHGQAAA